MEEKTNVGTSAWRWELKPEDWVRPFKESYRNRWKVIKNQVLGNKGVQILRKKGGNKRHLLREIGWSRGENSERDNILQDKINFSPRQGPHPYCYMLQRDWVKWGLILTTGHGITAFIDDLDKWDFRGVLGLKE